MRHYGTIDVLITSATYMTKKTVKKYLQPSDVWLNADLVKTELKDEFEETIMTKKRKTISSSIPYLQRFFKAQFFTPEQVPEFENKYNVVSKPNNNSKKVARMIGLCQTQFTWEDLVQFQVYINKLPPNVFDFKSVFLWVHCYNNGIIEGNLYDSYGNKVINKNLSQFFFNNQPIFLNVYFEAGISLGDVDEILITVKKWGKKVKRIAHLELKKILQKYEFQEDVDTILELNQVLACVIEHNLKSNHPKVCNYQIISQAK